jgi:hypothetical protein
VFKNVEKTTNKERNNILYIHVFSFGSENQTLAVRPGTLDTNYDNSSSMLLTFSVLENSGTVTC